VANEEGGLLKYAVLKPAVDFDRLEEVLVIVYSREPVPTIPQGTPQGGNTPAKGGGQ
jgi:rod shape-determining protein MreC